MIKGIIKVFIKKEKFEGDSRDEEKLKNTKKQ
jgi:hypothetical protein